MESDLEHQPHSFLNQYQQEHQQQKMNSGLSRYQSAPSSLFSSLLDREFCEEFFNRPSSPETEQIFARFLSSSGGGVGGGEVGDGGNPQTIGISDVLENSPTKEISVKIEPQTAPMNIETPHPGSFSSAAASPNFYETRPPLVPSTSSAMEYSSIGMNRIPAMKTGGGGTSNLIRHSSSPAGLFANIHIENGYVMMKKSGDFGGAKRERTFHSAGKPPPPPPPSLLRTSLPEIRSMNIGPNSPDISGFGENRTFSSSWEDPTLMPDTKRLREEDGTLSSEIQNIDTENRPPPILAHHLSLPKTPVEMSALEKLLQESVPCKIRAKRGFATHPRSIAERVRRTKISERMRKLQDLVPNMDKQTNTADMLDLAVEYIKDLQDKVKGLADLRARCRCIGGNKN